MILLLFFTSASNDIRVSIKYIMLVAIFNLNKLTRINVGKAPYFSTIKQLFIHQGTNLIDQRGQGKSIPRGLYGCGYTWGAWPWRQKHCIVVGICPWWIESFCCLCRPFRLYLYFFGLYWYNFEEEFHWFGIQHPGVCLFIWLVVPWLWFLIFIWPLNYTQPRHVCGKPWLCVI